MTDKKWYENIPKNGVLCSVECDNSQFFHIKNNAEFNEFCLDFAVNDDFLAPITPSEWWQFAPWHDIESLIPYDNVFLSDGKNIEKGFLGDCGFYKSFPICPSPELGFTPTKWLPLPEENQ